MRMRSLAPAARDWFRAVRATAPVARAEVLTKVRRETVLVCIRKRCESERLTRCVRRLFSQGKVGSLQAGDGALGTARPTARSQDVAEPALLQQVLDGVSEVNLWKSGVVFLKRRRVLAEVNRVGYQRTQPVFGY